MFEEISFGINGLSDGSAIHCYNDSDKAAEKDSPLDHKMEHDMNRSDCLNRNEASGESALIAESVPKPQNNEPESSHKDFGMLGINHLTNSLPMSPTKTDLNDENIAHSAFYEKPKSNLLDSPIVPIDHAENLIETSKGIATDTHVDYSMSASDYRLEQAIGYGSSAVVHLATYLPTMTSVAVKIIDLDRFERNQIDTLRREIQVMSLCRHPNLLSVLASFVNESQLWIVSPFLAAGSCLDLLRTVQFHSGICDEAAIATILIQALQGLEYLHSNGHIHRDIKAGNLLIDLDGQVQLADFGVSSSLLDNAGGRQGDVRKTFVGTPCWMAPEVMEMTKGYDSKADIWSFGITAYELATGSAPFAKLPPMKVIYMTLQNDPPKLDRHRDNFKFSRSFKEMISLCLQKDPSKRPTVESLLKHSFFKQAKRHEYLAQTILCEMKPIQERAKSNAKIGQKKTSHRTSSLKHETIPEEDWDFSSESEGDDGCEADPVCIDKRGRFVVGPNQILSPTTTAEENQASINSAADTGTEAGGIKKGRFCVNAAVTTTNGSGSPKILQETLNSSGLQSPPIDPDDEGRKSRFEILPNAAYHEHSQNNNCYQTKPAKIDEEPTSKVNFNLQDEPQIYRPQPHHHHQKAQPPQANSSMLPEYPPFLSSSHQQSLVLLNPSQIDHLIYLNDLIRSQLVEMRMGRTPYYPQPHHFHPSYDIYANPPNQQYPSHQNYGPFSPITSPHASQADLGLHGKSMADLNDQPSEGLGYRGSFFANPSTQRPRGQTTIPNDPVLAAERQLVMLRLENEQLKRRYQH